MSLINIKNLTFAYDGSCDTILSNVSFQLDTDWKLGFTGRNGRGKTTFLNLLMGKYHYEGNISTCVDFEYFPYKVPDIRKNTIDIVGEISSDYQPWQLLRELSLLRVSEDVLYRPFSTLSLGEQTKILLAVLFIKENSFLLIDEPTNHLDMDGRQILSDYLSAKHGYILVSHDRVFLDNCVDHILSINKTNIDVQSGTFSSWWANKQLQDEFERAQNIKLKKEIGRLERSAREKALWSDAAEKKKIGFDPEKVEKNTGRRAFEGAKSKKAMKRAKSIQNRQTSAIDEKSNLLKNLESTDTLKITPLKYHSTMLVCLDQVRIMYGEKSVGSDVSLIVEQGDRLALVGNNGSGKSSILKLIYGEDLAYTGKLYRGSRLKMSYVSQDTSNLSGTLTDYAADQGIDESLFKTILRKLGFQRVQFDKNMFDFSAGQKKKVLISRSLCEQAHLYIWDEPLNFVDVLSRIQIEKLLTDFKPTLLFVEHDKAFCDHIATKTINL